MLLDTHDYKLDLHHHQSSIELSRNTVPEKNQQIYIKTSVNQAGSVTHSLGVTIFNRSHSVHEITEFSYMDIKLASSLLSDKRFIRDVTLLFNVLMAIMI